jgi:hypothetical protein
MEVALPDELRVDGQARRGERRPVAVLARAAAEHMRGPADHPDAPVAQLEQVARRREPAVPVGGAHRGHPGGGLAGGIDDDEGDAARAQARGLLLGELGDDEDHAGRPPRGDRVDPRAPERAWPLLRGEDDAELVLARDLLHAADDLDRPWALELVEDHVEQSGAALAGGRAATVAVFTQQSLDPRARGRRHVGAPVDDLRDGRDRHSGRVGDVRDRHSAAAVVRAGHARETTRGFGQLSSFVVL